MCDNCDVSPVGCVLAGVIVGMLLLILLSSCGMVTVPEHVNVRRNDPLAFARGDAKAPVVRGDPFVLAMKTGTSRLNPYDE